MQTAVAVRSPHTVPHTAQGYTNLSLRGGCHGQQTSRIRRVCASSLGPLVQPKVPLVVLLLAGIGAVAAMRRHALAALSGAGMKLLHRWGRQRRAAQLTSKLADTGGLLCMLLHPTSCCPAQQAGPASNLVQVHP